MSHIDDLPDEAFWLLKSQSAAFSDSFSQQLEDRLMAEQHKLRHASAARRSLVAALAICGLLAAGAAASYAATEGWKLWSWTVSVESDGTVRDAEGEVVGTATRNEDGSMTARITTGEDAAYEIKSSSEALQGKQIKLFLKK